MLRGEESSCAATYPSEPRRPPSTRRPCEWLLTQTSAAAAGEGHPGGGCPLRSTRVFAGMEANVGRLVQACPQACVERGRAAWLCGHIDVVWNGVRVPALTEVCLHLRQCWVDYME